MRCVAMQRRVVVAVGRSIRALATTRRPPPPPPCWRSFAHSASAGAATSGSATSGVTDSNAAEGPAPCDVYCLGLTPFTESWSLQKEMQLRRMRNVEVADAVLLLEHPPVFTLGRGATEENIKFEFDRTKTPDLPPNCAAQLLFPDGVDVHRVERGGEVTFHGPGQLVMYPVINLNRHKRDLHWYMRQCEEVVIRTLADYGIEGTRDPEYTGVWVAGGTRKIAAMGFSVSRWVTMHGLALNVDLDLTPFEFIVPCGIDEKGRGVTSMRQQLTEEEAEAASSRTSIVALNKDEVARSLLKNFAAVFNLELHLHDTSASTTIID